MSNNKDPKKKRPGEKEDGTFHYNPGNMSGKTGDIRKGEPRKKANADRVRSLRNQRDKERA